MLVLHARVHLLRHLWVLARKRALLSRAPLSLVCKGIRGILEKDACSKREGLSYCQDQKERLESDIRVKRFDKYRML
jgi:hypothetical protein